jgi:hypothetical protein
MACLTLHLTNSQRVYHKSPNIAIKAERYPSVLWEAPVDHPLAAAEAVGLYGCCMDQRCGSTSCPILAYKQYKGFYYRESLLRVQITARVGQLR